jgi:WD40 repeat protein
MWDLLSGVWKRNIGSDERNEKHTKAVRALALSPDNVYLISGSDDCLCKIWYFKDLEEKIKNNEAVLYRQFKGHLAPVRSVTCTPKYSNGECFVVSGSEDKVLFNFRNKLCLDYN